MRALRTSSTPLTLTLTLGASVLLAGCGTTDPCSGQSGACIALTVTSTVVSRIDTLELTAFTGTKVSMSGESALPVQLAVVPPAGTAPGDYPLGVVARLGGPVVGAGSTTVTVGAGRTTASVELRVLSASDGGMDFGGVDLGGADLASGTCMAPTPDSCGGKCVNLQSDPQNCKTCGKICTYPHAGATCAAGACQIAACESGYQDCTGGPLDGCETYLATDEANCGACGKKCLLGQVCTNGACTDNLVDCMSPGIRCITNGCSSGKFAVSRGGGIPVDTVNLRKLWTRASRGPATYSNAKNDCAVLALEGITGWRLPSTYGEIPQYKTGGLNGCPTCNPAIDQAAFPDTKANSNGYWTAMYDMNAGGYASVNYCDGRNNYPEAPSNPLLYRCVHDPL